MDIASLLISLLIFVIGLIFGSFLSAFTYRFPLKKSIVKGRSFCDSCKEEIAWYDNIPLFSFLLVQGKCRKCHNKISPRYPTIELLTAVLLLLLFRFSCEPTSSQVYCLWKSGLGSFFPLYMFPVLLALISIFVIDLEKQIIPDSLVFFLWGATILFLLSVPGMSVYSHLLTGVLASLFLLSIFLLTKEKGMGLGDVKFALFAGTFLGYPHTITWLFTSFFLGAVIGVFLIIIRKATFGKHIPFGPFLVVSFFLAGLFGEFFLKWLNF